MFLEAGVEIVSFRVTGRGEVDKPRLATVAPTGFHVAGKPRPRAIYLGGEYGEVTAQVLRGSAVRPGDVIEGPAVIEHPSTTIFVGPGQVATIDDLENTVITAAAGAGAK